MNLRKLLSLLSISILITSCATGDLVRKGVHEGMSKDEVIATLGSPDGFKKAGESEALIYTNRLISGWSWDRTDYTVIINNGVVTEYGTGQVRQNGPNTLVIIPIK